MIPPIAVVLSMFPEAHETFIVRELAELKRQGVVFTVYSLQRPRDAVMHPDARDLLPQTEYVRLWGWNALTALLAETMRRPVRVLRAVARTVSLTWRRPADLVKSLAILPGALYFGRDMKRRGIVHAHGHWRTVPTTACWFIGQIQGLPWSAAIHGENIFEPNPLLREKLADARFVVTCTRHCWEHLRSGMGLPRTEDIFLNYHGLEPRVWEAGERREVRRDAEGGPRILSVGRLVGTKGHDTLLQALKRLRERGTASTLCLIGCGPEEAALRRLATELGVDGAVDFAGLLPFEAVLEAMHRADAFALACRIGPDGDRDGIPNVLAEAMALGVPVVATRVSAIPELVEDGVTGFLAEPDDPGGLADCLEKAFSMKRDNSSLREAARARARSLFDLQANVSDLIRIFDQYVAAEDTP